MVDVNTQFGGFLTNQGAAKKTNCDALGVPWKLTHMRLGDANGTDPVPNPAQTQLVHQVARLPLNQLYVSPVDANVLIAELVLPPDTGGWWIRELALEDEDGVFSAVANCAPSYKPVLAQGSGRNQVVRMHILTSGTANIQLKIDPSVVLATRAYCDGLIAAHLAAQDPHPQYTTEAEVAALIAAESATRDAKASVVAATTVNLAALSGLLTVDGVVLAAGARVLVKNQATSSQNGIYVAAAGAWSRSIDADISAEVTPGMLVTVEQGTENADTIWELTTNGPITLGTTSLTFELTATLNATQADAEAGTNNTRRMTALRVFQALRSAAAIATEALRGVLRVGTQVETDAGALDDVTVTPKKLRNGFSVSFTNNGYVVLPSWLGGLVIQWGNTTTNGSGVGALTFPLAFPTTCWHVVGTGRAASASLVGNLGGSGIPTQTGYTFYASINGSPGVLAIDWIAIGR